MQTFLQQWTAVNSKEREPPRFAFVRNEGALVSLMVTDFWLQIGGPRPYADSYTYSGL